MHLELETATWRSQPLLHIQQTTALLLTSDSPFWNSYLTQDTNSKPIGLLHSLPIPDRLWQSIGMDFMGPLPKSNNFNYLLVIIDQLMSQVHPVPTTMTVTARGIVWLILKEFMRSHGIPESIVSDRDTN